MKMNKANALKTLWASLAVAGMLSGNAQTSKELYNDLGKKDINKEISVWEIKSSLNTLSSSPARTVIKPTEYDFSYDIINSLYFDPTDSTRVAGSWWWGLSIDNTNIAGYTVANSCVAYWANVYSCYKDGDTLYFWTDYDSGFGWLVKLSPAGCSVNTNFTTTVQSITKFQGKLYVWSWQGVFVYNPDGTLFQHYTTTNSSLPSNIAQKIVPDNQGNLWIATGAWIVKFDGTNRIVYTGALSINYAKDIAIDNQWNVWAWNIGLFHFSGWVWSEVSVPVNVSQDPLNISGLATDQFNNLWIATKYHGVLKRDWGTGQWTVYDTGNSPLTTNQVNDVAVDTTSQDNIHIGIGSDETGFILLKESTASYLPGIPAGAHITGQNSVQTGQTYTYALSTPITNVQEYEWSYTWNWAATILPKLGGTAVEITFGLWATPGNVVLKAKNNYTKPVTDTVQLTFAVTNVITGIGENEIEKGKIVVAPNPASEIISLLGIEKWSVDVIEIYDMTGKLIKKQLVREWEETEDINIQDLVPWAYMILAKNTRHSTAFPVKFIKK